MPYYSFFKPIYLSNMNIETMKIKTFSVLFVFLLQMIFIKTSFSQPTGGFKCGTTEALNNLYKRHPELKTSYEQFVKENNSKTPGLKGKSQVYVIPVVVHVLHQYGEEDISDEQIYDAIKVLNRDYRKLNSDTGDIVPEFKLRAGDCKIEFRLATKDPAGNCTNGIDRIYSHETNIGDDFSKLHQWSRSNYLNVWVVKSIKSTNGDVAGYSYYPTAVAGTLSFADGIILLSDYIGSIGTSSVHTSRTLTHEIGHYLGLAHCWGSTNEPGVSCGDDGIMDTPVSFGWQSCQLTDNDICVPDTAENVQNYMEYSYCSRMFTKGQASFMKNTLENALASRNYLWSDTNLFYTGATSTMPVCTPVPDFKPMKNMVKAGNTVNFINYTWRAPADTYEWSFPGGTPSASNLANPSVVYNNPGWYDVSLTATNASGSNIKTETHSVFIVAPWVDIVGPYSENFENTDLGSYIILNPENNEARWQKAENTGYQSSKCIMLNNVTLSTDDFYYNRLGGNADAFVTQAFDLGTTQNASLSFTYSCATRAGNLEDISEELNVYASIDYGLTWLFLKNIKSVELTNAGYCSESYFPRQNTTWSTINLTIPTNLARRQNIRFKFEYIASDLSNNIFIDNINLNGILGTEEGINPLTDINLYPNPSEDNKAFSLSFTTLKECDVETNISDVIGNEIYKSFDKAGQGTFIKEFSGESLNLKKGIYLIRVKTTSQLEIKKLMIL